VCVRGGRWQPPPRVALRVRRCAQPYRLIVNRPVLWPLVSCLAPDQYSTTLR